MWMDDLLMMKSVCVLGTHCWAVGLCDIKKHEVSEEVKRVAGIF